MLDIPPIYSCPVDHVWEIRRLRGWPGRGDVAASISLQMCREGTCAVEAAAAGVVFAFSHALSGLAADQHGVRIRISQLRLQEDMVNPPRCAAYCRFEYHIDA